MLHPHQVDVLYLLHATIVINKRLIDCEVCVLCKTCSVAQLGHKVITYALRVIAGNQNSVILHYESVGCERAHQPRLGQEGNLVCNTRLNERELQSEPYSMSDCMLLHVNGILKTTSRRTGWSRAHSPITIAPR